MSRRNELDEATYDDYCTPGMYPTCLPQQEGGLLYGMHLSSGFLQHIEHTDRLTQAEMI